MLDPMILKKTQTNCTSILFLVLRLMTINSRSSSDSSMMLNQINNNSSNRKIEYHQEEEEEAIREYKTIRLLLDYFSRTLCSFVDVSCLLSQFAIHIAKSHFRKPKLLHLERHHIQAVIHGKQIIHDGHNSQGVYLFVSGH
mmetsp:Transcript_9023/g.13982  ORF Transcript_9023/g.13982 Transcript_9023/m.13982 type:complete len:141 (+) Transcript_9023:678-1100(+)